MEMLSKITKAEGSNVVISSARRESRGKVLSFAQVKHITQTRGETHHITTVLVLALAVSVSRWT